MKKLGVCVLATTLSLVMAGGLLLGVSGTAYAGGNTTTVTIAQPVVCFCAAPIYAANKLGYLKDAGLSVNYATVGGGDPAVAAAVTSGSAQFGMTNAITLEGFVKTGLPLVAVTGMNTGLGPEEFVVSKQTAQAKHISTNDPYAKVLKKMKGATVGVLGGHSTSGVVLSAMLKMAGLPASWVHQVTLSQPAMVAGLVHGSIDAFFNVPPAPQQAAARGGVIAFTSDQVPMFKKLVGVVLYTTHQTVVKNMAQAVVKGNNALLAAKTQAKALSATYAIVKGASHSALKDEILAGRVENGGLTAPGMNFTADTALKLGIVTSPLSSSQIRDSYTLRYVPQG